MPPQQTKEERKRAMDAASLTPEQQVGVVAGSGYTPTVINGRELQAPQTDFRTIGSTSINDISGLDTELPKITPDSSAGKAGTLLDEVRKIRESTLGKSAFQTEQENLQGIPEIVKTQNDLASQLKQIQNEADQLKIEAQTIPSILQQQFTGRGVTTGGLAPIQAGALRENQIKAATVASRGLVISSLLEATKGQLTTAQYMADRAVRQKYGPLEEEIATRLENAELILKSPQYDEETKNRATQRKMIEERNQSALTQARARETEANKLKIDIFANNQNISPKMATVLEGITDPVQLAQTATEAGLNLKKREDLYETRETVGGEIIEIQKDATGKVLSSRVIRQGAAGSAKAKAFVNVYKGIAQEAIAGGATPDEAVFAATALAENSGITVGVEEQNALLQSLGISPAGQEEIESPLPGEVTPISAEEFGQAVPGVIGRGTKALAKGFYGVGKGIADFGAGIIEGLISPFRK